MSVSAVLAFRSLPRIRSFAIAAPPGFHAALQGSRESSREAPGWLQLGPSGWAIRPEHAGVVQGIYKVYFEGMGMPSIARLLNTAGLDTFGRAKFWTTDTVWYLLHQHAVYGQLTREQCKEPPVPGYYPAIISKRDFDRVALLTRSKLRPRREVAGCFLFATHGSCAGCGERLRKISGQGHGYQLQCVKAFHRGGCLMPAISGRGVDLTFMREVAEGQALRIYTDDAVVAAAKRSLAELFARLKDERAERSALLALALAGARMTTQGKTLAKFDETIADLERKAATQRRATAPQYIADFGTARHLCCRRVSSTLYLPLLSGCFKKGNRKLELKWTTRIGVPRSDEPLAPG